MNQTQEFSRLTQDEIKFGFAVGQYRGPLSEPTYRQEVIDHGLEEVINDLLRGIAPEKLSWMQPVIDDQIANGEVNQPLRFMAVISELARAQAETERDLNYEKQVEALGRLLSDSCDENFNYLGFFKTIKSKDGTVHEYEWGRLELDSDTMGWHMPDGLPITEIEEILPPVPA
jgi:hypothetical protein